MFQARQDGNKIWGIIYSGSNQDGHMTSPITSPSGHQQGQLLNRMYTKNKINKDHMQVIEAHGKFVYDYNIIKNIYNLQDTSLKPFKRILF